MSSLLLRRRPSWSGIFLAALFGALVLVPGLGRAAAAAPAPAAGETGLLVFLVLRDRAESRWWEQGAGGATGSAQRALEGELRARAVSLVPARDLGGDALPATGALPTLEAAAGLARKLGAGAVLLVEGQASPLGPLPELELAAAQFEVSARWHDLRSGARAGRGGDPPALAYELEPVAARAAAQTVALQRLALWVATLQPQRPGPATAAPPAATLEVRGAQRTADLRQIVATLRERIAPFWIVEVGPGRARLAGQRAVSAEELMSVLGDATGLGPSIQVQVEGELLVLEILEGQGG